MTDKIQVGLVGYGMAGTVFHAPLISSVADLELKKIVSSNPAKVIADYPDAKVVSSLDELLDDPAIELVVVAAPNTVHFSSAKQALEAGKHVVVDKPFTNSTQDAEELIALAAKQNRLVSVFQNRRWDNDFLTLKNSIQSGLLGEIYSYEAHYDRFRPNVQHRWREQDLPGSGMLYDLGAHLIDQALHLFGTPKTVLADLQKQRSGSEVVDYFHILLDYGKLRVILHSSCIVRQPGPHFQLHGDRGSFIKYGLDSQEDLLKAGGRPGDAGWGADKPEFYGEITFDNSGLTVKGKVETLAGTYEEYYRQLAKAIREGQPLPVTATEARNTIKVIELAKQSSEQRKAVDFS